MAGALISGGTVGAVWLATGGGAAAAAPGAPAAAAGQVAPTVSADGTGEAIGTPDSLALAVSVDVTRSDVSAGLSAAGSAADAVTAALASDGVAKADVQTTDLSVAARTDKKGSVSGYRVTESLGVTLRDLGRAGRAIGDAVSAGGAAVRVQSLTPRLSDPRALGSSARDKAFADARGKAERYARLAGRSLGPVLTVDASNAAASGDSSRVGGQAAAAAAAAPVSISPGSAPVEVAVRVVWALR